MQVTVEFQCSKCGLLTPGMAEIPDSIDPEQAVRLTSERFHCDAPLEMVKKVKDLRQEK